MSDPHSKEARYSTITNQAKEIEGLRAALIEADIMAREVSHLKQSGHVGGELICAMGRFFDLRVKMEGKR